MKTAEDDWVSVVMPVRNALPFLDASISSILNQSHEKLELVIGDDGSTDGSTERLAEWARCDSRIRLFTSRAGCLGAAGSANWVVRLARHPIIARMDADDVSRPERLAAQLAALRSNPDAVLVGSLFDCIDANDRPLRPVNHAALARLHQAMPPFAHGSIMYHRWVFDSIGGYRSACEFWEDLDFYWRMAKHGRMLVTARPYFSYRCHPSHARLAVQKLRVEKALGTLMNCVEAMERGEDYEHVIAANPQKVHYRAFVEMAALEVWAGQSSTLLWPMLRRGTFTAEFKWLRSFVLLAMAAVTPGLLRATLGFRIRQANMAAAKWMTGDEVIDWLQPRTERKLPRASI